MHQDVVKYTAKRIVGVITTYSILHCLTDSKTQAAGAIWPLFQHTLSYFGIRAGAGDTIGTPGFHQDAAVGFLIKANPDHIDL